MLKYFIVDIIFYVIMLSFYVIILLFYVIMLLLRIFHVATQFYLLNFQEGADLIIDVELERQ